MLANFSAKLSPKTRRYLLIVLLPLWVLVGFAAAQALVVVVAFMLKTAGVPFVGINLVILNVIFTACIYLLSIVIVIGLPWWLWRQQVSQRDMGITRLPSWLDIGLAPAGLVIYLLFSGLLIYIVGLVMPGIDLQQVQDTGFSNLSHRYEYILAFVILIVVAPLAEEVLFRGYLYGKLRKLAPMWLVTLIVSALFGLVHWQWNVAIDVFALSIVLCSLREITGNIWAGVLLHMIKNSIAFYFLFINPALV